MCALLSLYLYQQKIKLAVILGCDPFTYIFLKNVFILLPLSNSGLYELVIS